jgi:hypothetical protein
MGAMWLFFCLFLSSQCDVGLNNDDICMNTSPLFCFLVEKPLVGNKILVWTPRRADAIHHIISQVRLRRNSSNKVKEQDFYC